MLKILYAPSRSVEWVVQPFLVPLFTKQTSTVGSKAVVDVHIGRSVDKVVLDVRAGRSVDEVAADPPF